MNGKDSLFKASNHHDLVSELMKEAVSNDDPIFLSFLVKRCWQKKRYLTKKYENGETLLHIACKLNLFKIVQRLIELGSNVDEKSDNGNTCLHICTKTSNCGIIFLLIEAGANPFIRNKNGDFPSDLISSEATNELLQHYILKRVEVEKLANLRASALSCASDIQEKRKRIISNVFNRSISIEVLDACDAKPIEWHDESGNKSDSELRKPVNKSYKLNRKSLTVLRKSVSHSPTKKNSFTNILNLKVFKSCERKNSSKKKALEVELEVPQRRISLPVILFNLPDT